MSVGVRYSRSTLTCIVHGEAKRKPVIIHARLYVRLFVVSYGRLVLPFLYRVVLQIKQLNFLPSRTEADFLRSQVAGILK